MPNSSFNMPSSVSEVEWMRMLLEEAVRRLFHYDLTDPVGDKINVYLHPHLIRSFFTDEEKARKKN